MKQLLTYIDNFKKIYYSLTIFCSSVELYCRLSLPSQKFWNALLCGDFGMNSYSVDGDEEMKH
jgi:hypothetical protein